MKFQLGTLQVYVTCGQAVMRFNIFWIIFWWSFAIHDMENVCKVHSI